MDGSRQALETMAAKTTPTVAVIIPTYNRAALLVEALESVLAQTFQDFEVFIVDDGSTDDTQIRLDPYLTDPRIHYLSQENGGPARARNTGIRASSSEFIALLDSDDLWLPTKLEKQIALLHAQPDIGLVYTDVTWIEANGEVMERQPVKAPRNFNTYYEDLLYDNVIIGSDSAVLLRRQILGGQELYDPALLTLEDQDLWLRISAGCKISFVDTPLVLLRVHQANLQQNPDSMARGRLLFVEKLKRTLLPAYRHHLPNVEYVQYRRIVFAYLLKRRFGSAARYLLKMMAANPANTLRFFVDALARLPRARDAHWR
jgi:glycosyltransferase involved in cell wall biosynthesis